ncbi:aldehyde dehydrogenase family protein [Catenulispora pinisilvae]|uniref:aldehyde dehydrogenase family protein n=1 Tax=Catenulispora pinisilvae TaxID=2705253 RepID=UPI0018926504|nr:aldehyde dehydrogenase family protein [Catenulispora pinisilvae]
MSDQGSANGAAVGVLEPGASSFVSYDPADGGEVATFPAMTAEQVRAVVAEARPAAAWWSALTWAERERRLRRWAGVITRGLDDLCELMHQENGKPRGDAFLEVFLAIEHIGWAAGHARKVLHPRRVGSGLLMSNHAASLEYQPLGVVGVIGPWNYPVFTPMGSIAYALAAGNAVVFKPSEYTTAIGKWIVDAFDRANPDAPQQVLRLVTGTGATGAALCESGVDKIAFTGSARTGRKVMAACAPSLTPVLMECGGKDAMIVAGDANLAKAADAALWGAMSNAGQTCVGIERVYVVDSVKDEFVTELTSQIQKLALAPGQGPDAAYGPMTMPGQLDVVRKHIDDALAKGATVVVGGSGSVRAPYVEPTVLLDTPEDSSAVREETFGPTITVKGVRDVEEAIELANATDYGLGASVFARRGGTAIARRLRSGMTSVNAVIAFAGIPGLPFGGVGESGFGRIHGADGLREFTRPKAITRRRYSTPFEPATFARNPKTFAIMKKYAETRYGRKK